MSKKLKDLKVGDEFYYVTNNLGVIVLVATNVLDCMSNDQMKVEMTCDGKPWPPIYKWKEVSDFYDDCGTYYFDKQDVIELLQERMEDIKATLMILQNGN